MDKKNHPYSDIIDLPRPVSAKWRRMTDLERAAQFSPFAALVGYDAAIREEGRLTSARLELAEDEKQMLDRKYRYLADFLYLHPQVKVTYFRPDSRKSGGDYITAVGKLSGISAQEQWLSLEGGERILFSDITALESPEFGDE